MHEKCFGTPTLDFYFSLPVSQKQNTFLLLFCFDYGTKYQKILVLNKQGGG
jgi:hypothetical protein